MNSLNQFFSRNTLRNCINRGPDNLYLSVVRQYVNNPGDKKNKEVISEIYNTLRNNYRNEYFYKNTLLNKFLLGIHSVNTAAALTEVAVAGSKADFILINRKAVVYEIKTELDNFERLPSQIADYYRAFDHVAVVTDEKKVRQLQNLLNGLHKPVGIYVLRKNGKLGTVQKPGSYMDDLDRNVLFSLLRKKEYESIVFGAYGFLPDTTQFQYYSACRKLTGQIPLEEFYALVLKHLKLRNRIKKEDLLRAPYALRTLAYFMMLTQNDYEKLDCFLEQQYGGV